MVFKGAGNLIIENIFKQAGIAKGGKPDRLHQFLQTWPNALKGIIPHIWSSDRVICWISGFSAATRAACGQQRSWLQAKEKGPEIFSKPSILFW
jgi:hypothetical protein